MTGFLLRLALLAASCSLILLFLDFGLGPYLLTKVPLNLQYAFPRNVRVLTQSSKAGAVPNDYVAVVGDSYAQGAGDWLREVNHSRNPPFHTAHVLNDRLGRDVITFGAAGAGSIRGMVTEPLTALHYLDETLLYGWEDPEVIVVYFYEGNDLSDNIQDLRARFDSSYDIRKIRDKEYFRSFIEEEGVRSHPAEEMRRNFSWYYNFILTRAALRHARSLVLDDEHFLFQNMNWPDGQVNRAVVAGEEIAIPDSLQSPGLDLTAEELDLSLYVFDRALEYMMEKLPNARILVVYLPSPITSYRISSPEVSIESSPLEGEREQIYSRGLLAQRSDQVCQWVQRTSSAMGAEFVDLRPVVWSHTEREMIHGPIDWRHFNRRGNIVVADSLAPRISGPRTSDECASFVDLLGSLKHEEESARLSAPMLRDMAISGRASGS